MIADLIALLETHLRWIVDGDLPCDASGAPLPEAWAGIANRLRSEGWEAEAGDDGVDVEGTIWLSFTPPNKVRLTVDVRHRRGFRT